MRREEVAFDMSKHINEYTHNMPQTRSTAFPRPQGRIDRKIYLTHKQHNDSMLFLLLCVATWVYGLYAICGQ